MSLVFEEMLARVGAEYGLELLPKRESGPNESDPEYENNSSQVYKLALDGMVIWSVFRREGLNKCRIISSLLDSYADMPSSLDEVERGLREVLREHDNMSWAKADRFANEYADQYGFTRMLPNLFVKREDFATSKVVTAVGFVWDRIRARREESGPKMGSGDTRMCESFDCLIETLDQWAEG